MFSDAKLGKPWPENTLWTASPEGLFSISENMLKWIIQVQYFDVLLPSLEEFPHFDPLFKWRLDVFKIGFIGGMKKLL